MTKRAATTSATSAKRAKGTAADPVAAKVEQIAASLKSADIPAGTLEVISFALPHSLGVASDERHRFQVEIVEMVGHELKKVEASLEEGIQAAEGAKKEAADKVASEAAMLATFQEGLEAKQQERTRCKVVLAGAARSFQDTKARRVEKLAQRESALADVAKAEASKAKIEALAKEVDTVHASEDKSAACTKFLATLSKNVQMDETMKLAIPSALKQSPEERGSFDAMVVQSLNGAIAKQLEELSSKIANAEPMRVALDTDVAAAESAHHVAKEAQKQSADLFIEAQGAVSTEDAKVKALQKELSNSRRRSKKAADSVCDAEAALDDFKTGELEAFTFLRDRKAPQLQEETEEAIAEQPSTAMEVPVGTAVAAC